MLRLMTFLAGVFIATGAFATQYLYVHAPTDGYLNLRTGPSTAYNVKAEMTHGSKIQVIATPGKWYKVADSYGNVGWAHSHYMSKYPVYQPKPEPHYKAMYVYAPKHGALNLRHGPGTGYGVIGKMPHGSKVKVLAAHGKWRKVKHQSGYVGWAHNAYLSLNKHHAYYAPVHKPAPWHGVSKACGHAPKGHYEACVSHQLAHALSK